MLDVVRDKTEDIISILENTGYYLINQHEKGGYQKFQKDDGSLLTELDIASDYLIKSNLKGLFGNIAVVAEENTAEENFEALKNKYYFLLDPIDGTTSFDKGGEFTINLAFCVDGEPKLGFIHNPRMKTLYYGDNEQAFRRTGGASRKLGKINQTSHKIVKKYEDASTEEQKPINIGVGSRFFENANLKTNFVKAMNDAGYNNFQLQNIKYIPAMGKLKRFIESQIDAFVILKNACDWDVLPALPIINAIKAENNITKKIVFENSKIKQDLVIVSKNEEILQTLQHILKED